jgi:hypothetical protein
MTESNLPNLCYVVVRGAEPGKRIGVIKRGEKGYYLTDYDTKTASTEIVAQFVAEQNKKLGVEPDVAMTMEIGSMFGWDCPGARVPEKAAR